MLIHKRRPIGGHIVTEFAHAAEGHRRELLLTSLHQLSATGEPRGVLDGADVDRGTGEQACTERCNDRLST